MARLQPDDPAAIDEDVETVYYDFIDDAGNLAGGKLLMPVDAFMRERREVAGTAVDNRIDLVTVGDGYAAGQLGTYATHANGVIGAMFSQQPFARYQHFYRVTPELASVPT
jgi:hypothetical protein